MARRSLDTSITDAVARRHLADANERDTLWCERISGFHLIKLKSGGSWRFRYQDALGKRRVATIGSYANLTPQQAAEKARAWRVDGVDVLAEKKQQRKEAHRDAALSEARTLRKYLEGSYARYQARKKRGDDTLKLIKHSFADLLDRDMADLSALDVRKWQSDREAAGRAHTTIRRAYGALKTMLNHAVRQDPPILEANPLANVSLEAPTHTERSEQLSADRAASRRILTPDEIEALHTGLAAFADEVRRQRRNSRSHGKPHLPDLDAVTYPNWFIPFAYCALYTGMRPGDLYSLTWGELNINFKRLNKVPEKTRHHPNPARINLELPDALLTIMRGWWEQHGKPANGLVFPSTITGREMDKKAHGKPWARVKKLGGLPDDLTFYALRHHFISTLVSEGVPLLVVARLVGHKGASMIEQHYGHLCPTASRDALSVLALSVAKRAAS